MGKARVRGGLRCGIVVVALVVGLVPAAEAKKSKPPLTPITCGLPVMDSITVANSLFECPLHGLVVKDRNVTIDLNGHTIDGNDVTDDSSVVEAGIYNEEGHDGLVVRNGAVRDFAIGVYFHGNGSRIKGVHALSNEVSGFFGGGNNHTFANNRSYGNDGEGFISYFANGHVYKANTAAGNGRNGFGTGGSAVGHTYEENVATANGEDGFNVKTFGTASENRDHLFAANSSWGNNDDGYDFDGDRVRLAGNKASGNGDGTSGIEGAGFRLTGDAHRLVANHAMGNLFHGFRLTGGIGHTLKTNTASGNGAGFRLDGSGHTLKRNVASGSTSRGFDLGGSGHTLNRNSATGNADHGFVLGAGDGITIASNKASWNGFINGLGDGEGFGFSIAPGMTNFTATGNKAWSNDDALQCSGLACSPGVDPDTTPPLTKVTCDFEVTDSIKVINSLTQCPLQGLVVMAQDVTIDLNGNLIRGNSETDDSSVVEAGVYNEDAHDGVIVRNGAVRGFAIGVYTHGDANRIRGVHAFRNETSGFFTGGADHILKKNFASGNGNGFIPYFSTGQNLTGNTAAGNSQDGFEFPTTGTGHVLSGNASITNGGHGFNFGGAAFAKSDHTLVGNAAWGNEEDGFNFDGNHHLLKFNRATGNAGYGIYFDGDGHVLKGNEVRSNGVDGIRYQSGNGGTLKANRVLGNLVWGVFVSGSGHTATGNVASGTGLHGFVIEGPGHIFDGNSASGNGEHGFFVAAGDGQTLVSNAGKRNGFANGIADGAGLGIFVDPQVTNLTASGNTGKKNDDPAQCSAVANCD